MIVGRQRWPRVSGLTSEEVNAWLVVHVAERRSWVVVA